MGEPPVAVFACGMCRRCYEQFLEVAGGAHAGQNPPAFAKAAIANLRRLQEEVRREPQRASQAILIQKKHFSEPPVPCAKAYIISMAAKKGPNALF
jgi:hypothetical protein